MVCPAQLVEVFILAMKTSASGRGPIKMTPKKWQPTHFSCYTKSMNIQQIVTRFSFCLLAWSTFTVGQTFAQTSDTTLLVDFTSSTTAIRTQAFRDSGAITENGFEVTLEETGESNFGYVGGFPITAGIFMDENTQFLIEATVGEMNDADYLISVREGNFNGEFFNIPVPAADLADDGQAVVSLRDVVFNGDTEDGIVNGSIHIIGFTSIYDNVDAVDVSVQRISVFNLLLGDTDHNRVVNFADIAPFIQSLTSGTYLREADIDGSGEVTFLDIAPFIAILAA